MPTPPPAGARAGAAAPRQPEVDEAEPDAVRVRQREEEAARLAGDAEIPRRLERMQRLEHHAERGEAEERRGADAQMQVLSPASVVGRFTPPCPLRFEPDRSLDHAYTRGTDDSRGCRRA
jgi:hypothetical protein